MFRPAASCRAGQATALLAAWVLLAAFGVQGCAYRRCDPAEGCIPVRQAHRWFTADRSLDGPLFREDGPSPYDVEQGDVGSCWLLSAMAATAQQQPQIIRDRFKTIGPGRVEVNFARPAGSDRTGDFPEGANSSTPAIVISTAVPYRVFAEKPLYARSRDGTWVSLLERAYAGIYAAGQGYEGIGGDHPRTALARLTGWEVEDHDIDGNLSGLSAEEEFQHLLRNYRDGAPMVAGSRIFQPRTDIVPMHAYAVTGVFRDDTGKRVVKLFDPESRADGAREVTLGLEEFSSYFFYVSIARPPQSTED